MYKNRIQIEEIINSGIFRGSNLIFLWILVYSEGFGIVSSKIKKEKQLKNQTILQVKPVENPTDMLAAGIKKEIHDDSQEHSDDSVTASVTVKSEQPQSVIKYLLSSPSSGSKTSVGLAESGAELVGGGGKKSISKKSKIIQEKASKAGKSKTAKQKLDLSSPTEGDDEDEDEDGANSMASLKMRISASSDPQSAQVTLNPKVNAPVMTEKSKKKKGKAVASLESPELVSTIKMESKAEPEDLSSPTSKKPNKKSSKKKEKLIQEAISAVKKLPAPGNQLESM